MCSRLVDDRDVAGVETVLSLVGFFSPQKASTAQKQNPVVALLSSDDEIETVIS